MDTEKSFLFLFVIGKELRRSFDCPVVLLTLKDYAEYIFNSLIDMRSAILQNVQPDQILDIINAFHKNWLEAVEAVENFKKRIKDTPRETIFQAFDYTMKCIKKRHKYFEEFMTINEPMTTTEKSLMEADLAILEELTELVNYALIEKQKSLRDTADKTDFQSTIINETEELLNWLDRLNDYLSLQLCKLLPLNVPMYPTDLTQTLQQTIEEVACYSTPKAQKATEGLYAKCKTLSSIAHANDLEIITIVNKIMELECRITKLKNEKSSCDPTVLRHKTLFLEDRLESLENLNLSLSFLKKQTGFSCQHIEADTFSSINDDDVRIFNHLLPYSERCHLVEKLVSLWHSAISGENKKSIISILSATDITEEFIDDIGRYTVDKHGRKIYIIENDHQLYQLDENKMLVPVADDDNHVYFYDECGRYYVTKDRIRIYKAHSSASEYMLRKTRLVKVSEEEGGVEYRYDSLGRYYVNGNGDHIYRERGSTDEYLSDGIGNLFKIRGSDPCYETCPTEPMVTEESKYLKKVVGDALKTCVAEVVMALPLDPIKYLADRLEKYWQREETRQREVAEKQMLEAERERFVNFEPAVEPSEPEAEAIDFNFMRYESQMV